MQDVADLWLLLQLTNSAFLVGLRGLFTAAPFVLAAFLGGALADRWDRRKLLAVTQTAYVLVAAAEGLLVATGQIQYWQIYIFGAVNLTISGVDTATRQSLIPSLVPREHLSSAIALVSSLRRGSSIIGPVIGGVTIATVGIGAAYFINAASFLPVVAAALAMRGVRAVPAGLRESLAASIGGGVRYTRARPVILGLFVLEAGHGFLQPVITMIPIFARDVVHVGPEGYGLMLSMMGVGALAATSSLILLGSRVVRGSYAIVAAFAYPTVLIGFALSRSFAVALAFLLLLGFMDIVAGTLRTTIVQIDVEDSYRGRVMGLMSMATRATSPLGAIPVGALASGIGVGLALAIGSLAAMGLTGLTALRVPSIGRFGRTRATDHTQPSPLPPAGEAMPVSSRT